MKIERVRRPDREWLEPKTPVAKERGEKGYYFDDNRSHLVRASILPLQRKSALQVRFEDLCWEWNKTRDEFSSGIDNFVLPAYQHIIGLGPDAVPLILRALQNQLDDWFWALRAITGADPVPAEHLGDFNQMRGDWFAWAKDNGIAW